ncbi:MAG: CoA-binding protein [Chloroflexi bacterium]|nr:CoA-binding protein [Chloroflexota bacterium]
MDQTLIEEFVNERVWAVVGASNNPQKYGQGIFNNLRQAGYVVYPVNPKETAVAGVSAFRRIQDLPEQPAVVDFATPPKVTEQVLLDCLDAGIERVWLQPGAESEAAIQFCQKHGIKVVYHTCAMVHRRTW